MITELTLGANYNDDNGTTTFCVWAPYAREIKLHLIAPQQELIAMHKKPLGYFEYTTKHIPPGSLYYYSLYNEDIADPASKYQPEGVFGPSQVISYQYPWADNNWRGLPLQDYIIYELHVGTYTQEGTLQSIIATLDRLANLGITAIELMPLAQFSGNRNWGYDGVFLFAMQNSYGTTKDLQDLVNACHQRGIAVILDVVYNHIGPEGNVLPRFAPYFTDYYHTPWGSALNFDGAMSDEVRRFFIENALSWVKNYHIDALRLDALHAIYDRSAIPFLQELADAIHHYAQQSNRRIYLIAESTLNDTKLIKPKKMGGYGLDALWNDEFHHALHTVLTKEDTGYYQDFGQFKQLIKAYTEGFVYSGQYSLFRQCRHGHSSEEITAEKFIIFAQNHDQVGNRLHSDRLSQHLNFNALKLCAAVILLSPYIPLIFMGEEYAETAPFYYFIDHSNETLVDAVRTGRTKEFANFNWEDTKIPDPKAEATYSQCKINPDLSKLDYHHYIYKLYQYLISLRKTIPALKNLDKHTMKVYSQQNNKTLIIHRWHDENEILSVYSFNEKQSTIQLPRLSNTWQKILDTYDQEWQGNHSTLANNLTLNEKQTITLQAYQMAVWQKQNGH